MRDEPSLSDGEIHELKPGYVLLTRRRWDAYFLPPIIAVTLIGALVFWFSTNATILKTPIPLIAIWLLIRWTWPREGIVDRTISATPGMAPVIKWLSICLFLGIGGIESLDYFLPLPKKGQPSSWRITIAWTAFMIGWTTVLVFGISCIEGRSKKIMVPDESFLE